MNLTDFVNSLHLQIEDFEATGKLGYVEGISRIIINGLKRVDTTKRPIHCTDMKRETLYIKQDNSWEKEDQNKANLKRAVNQVARMNLSQLPKWQKENPASEVLDTKENEEYIKYSMAALGGKGEEEEERFIDKIVKNVIREVVVSRKPYSGEPTVPNDAKHHPFGGHCVASEPPDAPSLQFGCEFIIFYFIKKVKGRGCHSRSLKP
jgi:hypothetical protein